MIKTILITGTNRGLGKACCEKLVSDGHRVIATTRVLENGHKAIDDIKAKYPEADISLYVLDVNDEQSINNCFQEISREHNQIDCLVNCAAILYPNTFKETSLEQLRSTLQTNLIGPFLMCHTFLPLIEAASAGKIINVTSQLGSLIESGTRFAAYRISKSAINSLTRVMHHELEESGVKIYSVCPGWVHTDMGGPEAPRTPEQGADSILFPFYSDEAKNGGFYQDGKIHSW